MLIGIYSTYNNIIYILLIVKGILVNNDRQVKSLQCHPIRWSWYIEKLSSARNGIFYKYLFDILSWNPSVDNTCFVSLTREFKKKKITKKTIFYESRFSLSYRFHEWTVLLALLCSAKQSFYVTSTNHSAELTKFPTRRILMQSTNWFVEKLVGCFASLELTEFFLSLSIVITWEDTG